LESEPGIFSASAICYDENRNLKSCSVWVCEGFQGDYSDCVASNLLNKECRSSDSRTSRMTCSVEFACPSRGFFSVCAQAVDLKNKKSTECEPSIIYCSNQSPVISGISDEPDPQIGGSEISFDSISSDPEEDPMNLYICKDSDCIDCPKLEIEGFEDEFLPEGWTTGPGPVYSDGWRPRLLYTIEWYQATNNAYTKSNAYSGFKSAASYSSLPDNKEAWIAVEKTFANDGQISFYWKVSSEKNYDFLIFCIDRENCTKYSMEDRISGEVNWEEKIYQVPAGTHTFKWVYVKDMAAAEGEDKGWIDQIIFREEDTSGCWATSSVTSINDPSASYVCPVPEEGTERESYWARVCDDYGACSGITSINDFGCRADGEIENYPPEAVFHCKQDGESGVCSAYSGSSNPVLQLINDSTDPNGKADIIRSEWTSEEGMSSASCVYCDYAVQSPFLRPDDYEVTLTVEDASGATDSFSRTITILRDSVADFRCSLDGETWEPCEGFRGVQKAEIYFIDDPLLETGDEHYSRPSQWASSIDSRTWRLNDVEFSTSYNPSVMLNDRQNTVELTIVDDQGRSDTRVYTFSTKLPLPTWKPIAP